MSTPAKHQEVLEQLNYQQDDDISDSDDEDDEDGIDLAEFGKANNKGAAELVSED